MSFKRQNKFSRYKAPIIVSVAALLTGVISFMITVKVYDNKFEIENKKIEIQKENKINENVIAKIESKELFEKASEKIEISNEIPDVKDEKVNEEILDVPEISIEEYEEFVGIFAVEEIENESENIVEVSLNINKENDSEIIKEEKKKLEFIMPLEGEYGLNYATEKLIYSNTLEEWITHNGIDIIGEEASPVKAIESGTIESIKMDPRYGNTIIIKHDEEYKSVYSNLSTVDLVYVGKKVEKGEIISGVGIGFGFESKEEPHVHLTILKNGESVNPEGVMNIAI